MHIDPIQLNGQNKLIRDYRNNDDAIMSYFDYAFSLTDLNNRVRDLNNRQFKREQLSECLLSMNKAWDASNKTITNIHRLKDENSVVIIGGQQAGILTGPMYTINKIISILYHAKEQEKSLGIPVIPVFWIAGEDHDFDEINHVYLPGKKEMQKHKLLQKVMYKYPVSDIKLDKPVVEEWLYQICSQLKETAYTNDLYQSLQNCLFLSETYVDFFARIIHLLFAEEGLVLVDSGNEALRKLESDYFVRMLEKQSEISSGVYETIRRIKEKDYPVSLDCNERDAHLFYHYNNERILLTRDQNGDWLGKQDEVKLTTEEILHIAENYPEQLSNNVVTRPVMQELLFPSLAFIGGPGEIAYWSVLKPAFHALDMKMPPVLPRLSFTYIDRHIEKIAHKYNISIESAVNGGIDQVRADWLASQHNPQVHAVVAQLKQTLTEAHKPLREIAKNLRADLGEIGERNLSHLHSEIAYFEKRILQAIEEKCSKELEEFDLLQKALHPAGGLQERIWNPLPFINEHGASFISQLLDQSFRMDEDHYIVYL
ncbi:MULTISPECIES: bacillithiol biosynthesis cysteine-adding enzyme BshC [unclassified Virgibacillus]|uniref:bacillithiol biosynthesis cysteine-adding enzyme BshC n=1 Tax=unclassified Virgibacillus TaxID=2620237 RepID=UPI0024DDFFFC|nr:bacillithiol biosynthesis cysteine-adding enzyme BshC [Virgibacillus sp. LDC-1]